MVSKNQIKLITSLQQKKYRTANKLFFAEGVKVIADWDSAAHHPDGSIVCIGGKSRYKYEHYILKTPNGWMDPWFDLKKNNMVAKYRDDYPKGADFLVALIPV